MNGCTHLTGSLLYSSLAAEVVSNATALEQQLQELERQADEVESAVNETEGLVTSTEGALDRVKIFFCCKTKALDESTY